jgi:DNA polymerase I-like protein with 3'-5' exonuclease and polymerase domains
MKTAEEIEVKDTQHYEEWRARLHASFETLNIIAEIEQHGGTQLTPVNKYNPGQHHGACPWYLNCPDGDTPCDADEDGFLVWPTLNRELQNGNARPKHYWCRKCKRSGDIANFLEQYSKIPIRQACALLGINPNDESIPYSDSSSVQKHGRSGPSEEQARTLAMVTSIYPYAQQMLTHPRALAYLAARSIPLEVAQALEIGYIPLKSEMVESAAIEDQWCDKILFPVQSASSVHGFRGRTLTRWQPGMDENVHRELLGTLDIAPWLATYEDGHFNMQALYQADCPVLVEGGFDVLACHSAGIQAIPVGTSRLPSLLRVRQVILALDNDESGRTASAWFASYLKRLGIGYRVCIPPAKDWSEAYRLFGAQGLVSLQETLQTLQFCEDCDISTFSSKKPFREHAGHLYCNFCDPGAIQMPPVAAQDRFEAQISFCYDCLDEGKETTARYEFDEIMYCEAHYAARTHSETYLTTIEQVRELAEHLEVPATYVLDLETTGLNPRQNKIITIALGNAEKVWTIDVRSFHIANEATKSRWVEALQRLLHRNDITWAGHNLKFDWSFLAVQFGVRLCKVYDTMLVEKLIHNGETGLKHNLLDVAARYDITVTKEQRSWFIDLDQRPLEWDMPLPSEQLTYIEQDIRVPHMLIGKQQETIEQLGLQRVVDLENNALPMVAAMEVHGITVDVARWLGILEAKILRKEQLEADIKTVLSTALEDKAEEDTAGKLFSVRPEIAINLGSREQLIAALAALGVSIEDTKAESLMEVKDQHAVVTQLLEWKELEKFISAFGERFLEKVESDGRIHANFNQLGAASGRFSCNNPNLQQIPKPKDDDTDIRRCFIAPTGSKLLVADLSNIELRILAEASGDPMMLRFFAEGKDLHSETARLMFKLGPDVDTKKHLINGVKARDIAKTINFGLAYGMGATGLAGRVSVDLETSKQLMNTYFATYKGVAGYLKQSGRKGTEHGYTVSLSGRRRSFSRAQLTDNKQRGEAERAAKNHPIQGTNADILKRALALLSEQLPEDVHVILTVHDEIVLEAPTDNVAVAENILKRTMVDACRDFLKTVTIPEPDVLIEDYWVKG